MAKIFAKFLMAIFATGYLPFAGAQENRSSNSSTQTPYINIYVPNKVRMGEVFQISVSLVPASRKPVIIHLDPGGIKYSEKQFILKSGERKFMTATATSTHDGIVWVHAYADAYPDAYNAVDAEYLGHLELTSSARLPYKSSTTLTLFLLDRDHKPISSDSETTVHIESSDAILRSGNKEGPLDLTIPANANVSPQFQIIPTKLQGGTVHLSTTLTLKDYDISLDSQSFTLPTEAAEWVPIVLALGGGILYGIYRSLNLESAPQVHTVLALLVTSALAGFLGYLIADLDLLGLKLDPTVLRSYPLLGFLVAYLGIDAFLKDKIPISKR